MRVLQSYPTGKGTTNPYFAQLSANLGPEPEVLGFSWRAALTDHYDVFHAHWPDTLLRTTTASRGVVSRLLFRALLLRLRLRRGHTAVVRTLHNLPGHDATNHVERDLLARLDRRTTMWIRLNPATAVPAGAPVRTIPHGDYRDWFDAASLRPPVRGRLVFFGVIRPSKGVPDFIRAFSSLPLGPEGDAVSVRVVGSPTTVDLGAEVLLAAQADDRVTVALGHATDDELAAEVSQAELVALPYREKHDSGAAILALSLGRPILVPSTPTTEALRMEVGRGWVFTYSGPLTGAVLGDAVARCRSERAGLVDSPNLAARAWPVIAAQHREAYSAALVLTRSHGRIVHVEPATAVDSGAATAGVPQVDGHGLG